MTQTSFPKKNKPGRVGVKRRRPTTNQALKARNSELETKLHSVQDGSVSTVRFDNAMDCIRKVHEMTDKSRTGVAHKVNELVTGFLGAYG